MKIPLKILQLASSAYLTESYPFDWEDLTAAEQREFISDHLWGPLENEPTCLIADAIDDLAENIHAAMREH